MVGFNITKTDVFRTGCNAGLNHADHVVELQVVKHVLNTYAKGRINDTHLCQIARVFNDGPNIQIISQEENRRKKAAVGEWIRRAKLKDGDQDFINRVIDRWTCLREGFDEDVGWQKDFVANLDLFCA